MTRRRLPQPELGEEWKSGGVAANELQRRAQNIGGHETSDQTSTAHAETCAVAGAMPGIGTDLPAGFVEREPRAASARTRSHGRAVRSRVRIEPWGAEMLEPRGDVTRSHASTKEQGFRDCRAARWQHRSGLLMPIPDESIPSTWHSVTGVRIGQ